MHSDDTFYITCTVFSLVLTLQLTHFWWRGGKDPGVVCWMIAGWVFVLTDVLFIFRPSMSLSLGRILPMMMVTAAYGMLLWASMRAAGRRFLVAYLGLIVFVHASILYGMDRFGDFGEGRIVLDRVVWASLCFGAAVCLRRASPYFWKSINSPATILICQGIFFTFRALTSGVLVTFNWRTPVTPLLVLGNVDIILFNGSFFVAVLITLLHVGKEELSSAKVEMETLSELLPVCAWCKKVRDDDGYWREISEYFSKKNVVKMTHGICHGCEERMAANVTQTH